MLCPRWASNHIYSVLSLTGFFPFTDTTLWLVSLVLCPWWASTHIYRVPSQASSLSPTQSFTYFPSAPSFTTSSGLALAPFPWVGFPHGPDLAPTRSPRLRPNISAGERLPNHTCFQIHEWKCEELTFPNLLLLGRCGDSRTSDKSTGVLRHL